MLPVRDVVYGGGGKFLETVDLGLGGKEVMVLQIRLEMGCEIGSKI